MVSPAHGPHRQCPVQPIAPPFYGQPSPWPDLPNFVMLRILKFLKCWNLENFEMLKILESSKFWKFEILKIRDS
jgi:hypothetical protein